MPQADWKAAREEKLQRLQDRLARAVEAMTTGDDWIKAVQFAARFRSRSFSNTVLIWAQHIDAHAQGRVEAEYPTLVAGYRQWEQLGRHVQRGQHGYSIIAPVTTRIATASPDDPSSWRPLKAGERARPGETVRSRIVSVKPATVFDVSQTEGDPLPERPAPALLDGQAPPGLWDGLKHLVEGEGFPVSTVPSAGDIGGANGQTSRFPEMAVVVRSDMDPLAMAKTLAHELGHVLLHDPDDPDATRHRGIAEVEAESFACMVLAAHGADSTRYTVPYVSDWASTVKGRQPLDVVRRVADRVRTAAIATLDQLDTQQLPNGDPAQLAARTRPKPPPGGAQPTAETVAADLVAPPPSPAAASPAPTI
jgi:antirestriction protein ArdC